MIPGPRPEQLSRTTCWLGRRRRAAAAVPRSRAPSRGMDHHAGRAGRSASASRRTRGRHRAGPAQDLPIRGDAACRLTVRRWTPAPPRCRWYPFPEQTVAGGPPGRRTGIRRDPCEWPSVAPHEPSAGITMLIGLSATMVAVVTDGVDTRGGGLWSGRSCCTPGPQLDTAAAARAPAPSAGSRLRRPSGRVGVHRRQTGMRGDREAKGAGNRVEHPVRAPAGYGSRSTGNASARALRRAPRLGRGSSGRSASPAPPAGPGGCPENPPGRRVRRVL
jgi:hypothetical protein